MDAFFWISTNAPIFDSSPISHPYRLMNLPSLTSLPSFTLAATHAYSFACIRPRAESVKGGALRGDRESRRQHAPLPDTTARGVASRILMSVQAELFFAYLRSSRTISSDVVRLRPLTCQHA